MAVTGVFNADFGSFFDAVSKSEIQLKSLETGANKVGDNLSRMGNAFSGHKIIQDATLMAKVFEDAGGAAAFTDKELARMGATANEAIAKLTALGKDIPPGIQKIADETKDVTKETDTWAGSLKGVVAGFISLQTARAAWNFVKDIADTAGALQDLSEQTQIGVEDLQIMANAMSDFGVDAETLGRGLFKLSKTIAGGDDSVADALLNMGLSLEQVKNMRGEELFLTIQNGLAKLDGSLRDTTAITLYGEKLGMAMAGAAQGTQAAIDEQKRLNNVWSQDTVEALDSATESIDKMTGSLKAMAANAIGPVAEGFNNLVATVNKGASIWQIAVAMAKDLGDSWDMGRESGTHLATLMDQLNQSTAAVTTTTREDTTAARENAAAKTDQAGSTKRLREAQAGLADFQAQTDAAKAFQVVIDEGVQKEQAAEKLRVENLAKKLQAGAGYMAQLNETARINKEAADFEKNLIDQQKIIDEENKKQIESLTEVGKKHEEAGDKAAEGTAKAVEGYQAVATQITVTADGLRAWIELQKFSMQANAILNRNSLFTTPGQLEEIANLPTSFAGGGNAFSGGRGNAGDAVPNLPGGTSAKPNGAGGGMNVSNTFNLVDTESNLARRVSETIMKTVRAGTQLGTA